MRCGFVAIAGRPNAGKSTLLNGILNEKLAIVSSKPQTTRSQIRGIYTKDDTQIIFTDTPGIHKASDRLENRMNKEAGNVILGVDVIYLVVDGSAPYGKGDAFVLDVVKNADVPVFLILNKIDKLNKAEILKILSAYQKRYAFAEYFPISAKKETDFHALIQSTIPYLPEGDFMYPTDLDTDHSENFRIAEIIREKVLRNTEEEVPHACAVKVETNETYEGIREIQAVIYVEREGQKAIIIGKQGAMLKTIGSQARSDIEALIGQHARLSLFVRVEGKWRDSDPKITDFGYGNIDE